MLLLQPSPDGHIIGETDGNSSEVRVSRGPPVLFDQGVVPAWTAAAIPAPGEENSPFRLRSLGISSVLFFSRQPVFFHLRSHLTGKITAVPCLHLRKCVAESRRGGAIPFSVSAAAFFSADRLSGLDEAAAISPRADAWL